MRVSCHVGDSTSFVVFDLCMCGRAASEERRCFLSFITSIPGVNKQSRGRPGARWSCLLRTLQLLSFCWVEFAGT